MFTPLNDHHRFWISQTYHLILSREAAFSDFFFARLQEASPSVLCTLNTDRRVQRAELIGTLAPMVGLALDLEGILPREVFGSAAGLAISPAHHDAAFIAFFFALDRIVPAPDEDTRRIIQDAWRIVFKWARANHPAAGIDVA